MDKVAEFQRKLALKQCYSRQPMYFKRHLINQQKLNNFLERSAFEDWSVYSLSRQNSDLEKLTDATWNTEQLDLTEIGNITFKTLMERLEQAERNYEQLHTELKLERGLPKRTSKALGVAQQLLTNPSRMSFRSSR